MFVEYKEGHFVNLDHIIDAKLMEWTDQEGDKTTVLYVALTDGSHAYYKTYQPILNAMRRSNGVRYSGEDDAQHERRSYVALFNKGLKDE